MAHRAALAGSEVVHFQNRNEMYTDRVFAGLAMVTAIGLLVEGWYLRPGKADGETLGYAELAPEQEGEECA